MNYYCHINPSLRTRIIKTKMTTKRMKSLNHHLEDNLHLLLLLINPLPLALSLTNLLLLTHILTYNTHNTFNILSFNLNTNLFTHNINISNNSNSFNKCPRL